MTRNLDPCATCGRVMCDCDAARDELCDVIQFVLDQRMTSTEAYGFAPLVADAILANPAVVLRALGGEPYGHADYAVEGEMAYHDLWAFPSKGQG